MAPLTKGLRRQLKGTVAEARKIAVEGAERSLQRLAVDVSRPHDFLTAEETQLRISLRAHAKQLGDRLTEPLARLVQAVAYEHWHRLLFARFLIENDLLLHPEHGVALSLDEVKEIALGENREWVDVAADYAQQMLLRRVFRPEDPALRVPLPPEKRLQLEAKLNSLPREVFLADDSLGWVYQFWQEEEKKRINKSEVAIGAEELGPVTQLFTEDYMVLFLLENSLGAWWTARHGKPELPGYTWTYLRVDPDGAPAVGGFDAWPATAKELRLLDPCMGSGHFLTFALPILARMRMEEEGLTLQEAAFAVLRDNLFGLELDERCSQIAAFNLALSAWKLAQAHFELPMLNLACSGLGINATEEHWVALAGGDGRQKDWMRKLFAMFRRAPLLGSLIDPTRIGGPLFRKELESIWPLVEQALSAERSDVEERELAITAQGLLASARFLSDHYTLVITNVPYLGRGRQTEELREFSSEFFSDAKDDIAQVFVERCLRLCFPGATVALIAPQKWTFAPRYREYRRRTLTRVHLEMVALLGKGAFQTITGEVVDPGAFIISATSKATDGSRFDWLDVSQSKSTSDKATALQLDTIQLLDQAAMLTNQDSIIRPPFSSGIPLLRDFAFSVSGLKSGDNDRFTRKFWELSRISRDWEVLQCSANQDEELGGLTSVIYWQGGSGELAQLAERMKGTNHVVQNWKRGQDAWGKRGIAISATGRIRACLYLGDRFDSGVTVLVPHDSDNIGALWHYCRSEEFRDSIKKIDSKLSITTATLTKIPFALAHWQEVSDVNDGMPRVYSTDPTQWMFGGHPAGSANPLQVAVARLVGYQWPRQTGAIFADCPKLGMDGLEEQCDSDGIVCLAALPGKESAAERLRSLLRAAYGVQYNLADLLNGKESATLEDWLRDEFFQEHCKIFHQHPFVWHVWDGRKDGFHALVNYHKLDHKTLEKLIYSSLGDWISRQRQDLGSAEGADGRLVAAEHLQTELKKIFDGKKPYDVFVRWKPLKEQPLGWNPDLNDGVRVNIRPWITEGRLYRAAKPGLLREKVNISFGTDRGEETERDPKEFPWFKDCSERNNDIHLSLDEKWRARGLI